MKNRRIEFFLLGVLLAFGISFIIKSSNAPGESDNDRLEDADIRIRSQLSGLHGVSTRELTAKHTLYHYAIVYLEQSGSSKAKFEKLISDDSAFKVSHRSPRNMTEPTLFLSEKQNLRWEPVDEWGMDEEPPKTWPHAIEVWLYSPDKGLLQNVLDAQTLLYEFAKATGGLIADIEAKTVFEVDAWKKNRLNRWVDKYPYVPSHVTMTYLKRGRWYRARTMGMRKFGLPEITVAGFISSHLTELDALLKLTCQTLIERPFLDAGGRYRLNVSEIAETRLKDQLRKIGDESAPGTIEIELALIKTVDEHANHNLEIRCLHLPGLMLMQKQEYLVAQLFGASAHKVGGNE